MNFDSVKSSLQGKKTYIATGMGVLYLAGVFLQLWEFDERVLAVFGLGGLAFLRAAVPAGAGPKAAGAGQAGAGQASAGQAGAGQNAALNVLLLALVLVGLSGCASLEEPGPYDGDRILYNADQAITATYESLDAFVSWEFEQRATLARWPEIRQAADLIRDHAESWIDTAIVARDKYSAFRSSETRQALVDALAQLRSKASTATSLLDLYGPSNSH